MPTGYPWLTRTEAAELIGLSTKQLDDAVRPRLPASSERGAGKKLQINAVALVVALVEYRLSQVNKDPDGDPLLSGGGESVWLEEYRKQKAGQEEIKLAEMRLQSIPLEKIEGVLNLYGATLRQTAMNLQRRFGPEAVSIFNEGVDEALGAAEGWLSEVHERSDAVRDTTSGRAVQDAAAADDAGVRRAGNTPAQRSARRKAVQPRKKPV